MASYFVDSSGIVKRYIAEPGSNWVSELLANPANSIYVSVVAQVEVISAFARRVRNGTLTHEEAGSLSAQFESDVGSDYRSIDLTSEIIHRAKQLTLAHGLRAYDAIQLSSALETDSASVLAAGTRLIFVSADGTLNGAASAEGITVENPSDQK